LFLPRDENIRKEAKKGEPRIILIMYV